MSEKLRDWIKREIKFRGLSQRGFAKLTELSHAYVSDILRGAKPVTRDFCFAVSKATGEPVWKILEMADLMENVSKDLTEDDDIKTLIIKFNKLSSQGKIDVLRYIDYVIIKEQ